MPGQEGCVHVKWSNSREGEQTRWNDLAVRGDDEQVWANIHYSSNRLRIAYPLRLEDFEAKLTRSDFDRRLRNPIMATRRAVRLGDHNLDPVATLYQQT